MSKKRQILIYARQPGSLSALLPLKTTLANEYDFKVLATSLAAGVTEDLKQLEIAESEKDVLSYLEKDFDIFLSGTSTEVSKDKVLWAKAKAHGIPVVAYFDHWHNLHERLPVNRDEHPSCLALLDFLMQEKLLSSGIERDQTVVTGSPQFELLYNRRADIRRAAEGENIAVFATEPVSSKFKEEYGFDDLDALRLAAEMLSRQAGKYQKVSGMLIKLHPRDSVSRISPIISELTQKYSVPEIAISNWSKYQVFAKASVIFGMSSMFLFEAAALGIPVISCQPQRLKSIDFIERNKFIDVACDPNQMTIEDAFNNETESFVTDASSRFSALFKKLISQ